VRSLPVSAIAKNGTGGVPMAIFMRYSPSLGVTATPLSVVAKDRLMWWWLREIEPRIRLLLRCSVVMEEL